MNLYIVGRVWYAGGPVDGPNVETLIKSIHLERENALDEYDKVKKECVSQTIGPSWHPYLVVWDTVKQQEIIGEGFGRYSY